MLNHSLQKLIRTALRAMLCVLLCLSLCGCSMTLFDVEKLMQPPQATGNKEALHKLLLEDAGSPLEFVYPRSGDYRSAVITSAFAGGAVTGSIAFCENKTGGTTLYFTIFDGQNWQIVGKVENPSSQVDRVCFGDLDHDNQDEVVVSWGSVQSLSSILSVYDYHDNTVDEYNLDRPYGEFAVTDLDDDGQSELFVAEAYTPTAKTETNFAAVESPPLALLYRLRNQQLEIYMAAELDSEVVRYSQLTVTPIAQYQSGTMVVLDGVRGDNTMVTQLVYVNNAKNALITPLSDTTNITERPSSSGILAQDIDGDGVFEIPVVRQMPLPSDTQPQAVSYIVSWQKFFPGQNTTQTVSNTVINATDGYRFEMPDAWLTGTVTFLYDDSTGTLTVYRVERPENMPMLGAALLHIRRYTREEWNSLAETENYSIVYESGNTIFAAAIPSPEDELSITLEEVTDRLIPLTE